MSRKLLLCAAALCFLCAAGRTAVCESPKEELSETSESFAEEISPSDAASLAEKYRGRADFVILDVRTDGEFTTGFIEGAVNLDYSKEDFLDQLEKLDKDSVYLVYCQAGGRSRRAMERMRERGFTRIYNLTGGISLWRDENLPVKK
ncbi:MAG: rhodanese-like domain-containing protein [Spirochaetes bacterium]|nr:rhodanese-like domain-containing protein [Spirochaetota bacterium]